MNAWLEWLLMPLWILLYLCVLLVASAALALSDLTHFVRTLRFTRRRTPPP